MRILTDRRRPLDQSLRPCDAVAIQRQVTQICIAGVRGAHQLARLAE